MFICGSSVCDLGSVFKWEWLQEFMGGCGFRSVYMGVA